MTSAEEQYEGTSGAASGDHRNQDEGDGSVLTVGLVASPELGERVATRAAKTLPGELAANVDDRVRWRIMIVRDALTGSNLEAPALLDEVRERLDAGGWDYAVGITDLPIRRRKRIVVAGARLPAKCAWLSIPALGIVRVNHRAQRAMVELVGDLHASAIASDKPDRRTMHAAFGHARRSRGTNDDGEPIDVQYVTPAVVGTIQLVAGMVWANTPWTLFPSFKATIATAFATGAYGLIFPTLWKLGDTYGALRQLALMLAAMGILISWVIISHNLWEFRRDGKSSFLTMLYNSATVFTIATAVVFAYAAIFVLILLAGTVFVPDAMLEDTLNHPADAANYVRIAWVTASVATIAGAVGAGLEDSEAVRDATFGWRQHNRYEEYARNREGDADRAGR